MDLMLGEGMKDGWAIKGMKVKRQRKWLRRMDIMCVYY